MLFHYHFWTPHLEEMEDYYRRLGFTVQQRLGKYQNKFQSFDPPLNWEDFRDKGILFRIVEMKKGCINITFGFGKRPIFDHIGFLVSEQEQRDICERANSLGWHVDAGERRTFLSGPYGLRIELQTRTEVIEEGGSGAKIKRMAITATERGLEKDLSYLFGREMEELEISAGEKLHLNEVSLSRIKEVDLPDPNGVLIVKNH